VLWKKVAMNANDDEDEAALLLQEETPRREGAESLQIHKSWLVHPTLTST
jgi:hypothetical protein